jgi:hypothetical protein
MRYEPTDFEWSAIRLMLPNRKTAPSPDSAAPSSPAPVANRITATESPAEKACNGLLQQNLPNADIAEPTPGDTQKFLALIHGLMFWFRRNRLIGSYFFFRAASRAYLDDP